MSSKQDLEFYCYFCYLGPFWLIGLLADRLCDKRLRFHVNQGVLLFIADIVLCLLAWPVSALLGHIPLVGGVAGVAVWLAAAAAVCIASGRCMLNVSRGKDKRIPLIGNITLIK